MLICTYNKIIYSTLAFVSNHSVTRIYCIQKGTHKKYSLWKNARPNHECSGTNPTHAWPGQADPGELRVAQLDHSLSWTSSRLGSRKKLFRWELQVVRQPNLISRATRRLIPLAVEVASQLQLMWWPHQTSQFHRMKGRPHKFSQYQMPSGKDWQVTSWQGVTWRCHQFTNTWHKQGGLTLMWESNGTSSIDKFIPGASGGLGGPSAVKPSPEVASPARWHSLIWTAKTRVQQGVFFRWAQPGILPVYVYVRDHPVTVARASFPGPPALRNWCWPIALKVMPCLVPSGQRKPIRPWIPCLLVQYPLKSGVDASADMP